MLQYRGELLSLEDNGGVVAEMMQAMKENGDAEARGCHATSSSDRGLGQGVATVLICGERRLRTAKYAQGDVRRRGRVVRRVVDVTTGTLLTHEQGAGVADEVGLALVNARVTMVCGGSEGAARSRELA